MPMMSLQIPKELDFWLVEMQEQLNIGSKNDVVIEVLERYKKQLL